MAKPIVKQSGRVIERRICVSCGRDGGVDGPLSYSWDSHWRSGRMDMTCSASCRRAENLPERKAVV